MPKVLPKQADKYIRARRRRRIWRNAVTLLSCTVVFFTTYALILPAITMEEEVFCGSDSHTHGDECYALTLCCGSGTDAADPAAPAESDERAQPEETASPNAAEDAEEVPAPVHQHTEACWEKALICTLSEHQHSLACYADPTADVESAEIWTRTLPGTRTGDSGADLAAAALSQLGYGESTLNYIVLEDGGISQVCGYTRYGDWYGQPYTEWNSVFAAFCLRYAGISESDVPFDPDCARWVELLSAAGLYQTIWSVQPEVGSLVFLDTDGDGNADRVGIVTGVDLSSSVYLETVEGDSGGFVTRCSYPATDLSLLGFALLPPAETDSKPSPEPTGGASLTLQAADGTLLPDGAELSVLPLDADSELAKLFSGDTAACDIASAEQWLFREITLSREGLALDSTDCMFNVQVTVSEDFLAPLRSALAAITDAASEADLAITLSLFQTDETQTVTQAASVDIAPDEPAPVLTAQVHSGALALRAAASANPSYTVQYYANLPRFSSAGDAALTVFDTSGGVLPRNNQANQVKEIYLTKAGGTTSQNNGSATALYQVATESKLTRIYGENQYEYVRQPTLSYADKLADNDSYQLSEIWVLKEGRQPDSTDPDDWTVYEDAAALHFTNRQSVAAGRSDMIFLSDGAVLRLVYDPADSTFTTAANFYDYDISSGQSGGTWNTAAQGINSPANYTGYNGTGAKFAFGNSNCGTGMADYRFDGLYLNQYSKKDSSKTAYDLNYGCTFGLAGTLNADSSISPPAGLSAPHIFSGSGVTGKHDYENSSLTFHQVGDTYTLTSAQVNGAASAATGLDRFFNPSPTASTVHTHIFTNNFWPVDSVPAENRTDPLFGAAGTSIAHSNGHFPLSDDGNAHNCFFGMTYAVEFSLTEDYVGPLDYTFFGDDDMWVFLDGMLVCDIGGVHSSVGEYVNLWDYLTAGTTGTHTLTFFYTERGASGSTCYMNFTLPSVSGIHLEQKTGSLRVEKELVGETAPDKEFTFQIQFSDSSGTDVLDDYAYTRYDADGQEIGRELIIHDDGTFTLKNGEYIVIRYLPFGLCYAITETGTEGYTVTNRVNGADGSGPAVSGQVSQSAANTVRFTNTAGYTLPETGGSGVWLFAAGGSLLTAVSLLGILLLRRKREGGACVTKP